MRRTSRILGACLQRGVLPVCFLDSSSSSSRDKSNKPLIVTSTSQYGGNLDEMSLVSESEPPTLSLVLHPKRIWRLGRG